MCRSEKFQNRFLFFVDFENKYNSGRDQTNLIGLNSGAFSVRPRYSPKRRLVIESSKSIRFELNSSDANKKKIETRNLAYGMCACNFNRPIRIQQAGKTLLSCQMHVNGKALKSEPGNFSHWRRRWIFTKKLQIAKTMSHCKKWKMLNILCLQASNFGNSLFDPFRNVRKLVVSF